MAFTLDYETLRAWCVRQQYEHRANAEAGQLAISYKILEADAPLMVLPQPSRGMVLFAMEMPFRATPERHAALFEAIALLNANAYMGAWVLNSETGELFFRVTVPSLDTQYTDGGLVHVARVVVGTCERVAAGLRAVALDGAAPQTAVPAKV